MPTSAPPAPCPARRPPAAPPDPLPWWARGWVGGALVGALVLSLFVGVTDYLIAGATAPSTDRPSMAVREVPAPPVAPASGSSPAAPTEPDPAAPAPAGASLRRTTGADVAHPAERGPTARADTTRADAPRAGGSRTRATAGEPVPALTSRPPRGLVPGVLLTRATPVGEVAPALARRADRPGRVRAQGTTMPTRPTLAEERAVTARILRSARALIGTTLPGIAPLVGWGSWVVPVADYRITAEFGQSGSLWSSDHTGLDLAAPTGTPVAAVDAGVVTSAGAAGAYGLKVEVTHADGTETWYCHLSRIDVTVGTAVPRGGRVGAVGATGNVTGPHLHLEVRTPGGEAVDPYAALRAHGAL